MNEKINLYLDDLRDCPSRFTIARTVEEAIYYLESFTIGILSLDHDLGEDEKIDNMANNYIIINDKVFKPQIHNLKLDGSHTLYNISIVMSDDTVIDGRDDSLFNKNEINLSRKTEYNRSKTFKTLLYKVLQYHKKFDIEPKEEFLDKKLTSEFQEISKWFKSINIKINI